MGPFESCYKFVTSTKATWKQANAFCMDMDSTLATLGSYDEIFWMKGYRSHHPQLRQSDMWIGGYKKAGVWVWKGEVVDAPILIADWASGQPDNHGDSQGCVRLVGDYSGYPSATWWFRFDDSSCAITRGFICERMMHKI